MGVAKTNWTPNRYRHGWIPLDAAFHRINFHPGRRRGGFGRGLIDEAGNVHTWPEEEMSHRQYVDSALHPLDIHGDAVKFVISKTGDVTVYGTSALKYSDQEIIRRIQAADPRLRVTRVTARVAKQTVSTGSSTGQTVTLNMNTTRLRAYRKLRRQGKPHHQALAMAKRVRMAKQAPYTAHHPPIIHHGKPNWVVREGGMPGPIDAIARVLIAQGWSESRAEATAVSQAKKECATGRAFGGKVPLHPASRAVICAAVAHWEAMKAAA